MTETRYGALIEPATLRITRLLPGPIERVWAYLTNSDLRRQWLAAGTMELTPGSEFELVWRNGELTDQPGGRPEWASEGHRLTCHIIAAEPPRLLAYQFGPHGEVRFDLAPQGDEVSLVLTHTRLPNRETTLKVSAGWHAHLDVMESKLRGETPEPFWDHWKALHAAYGERLPA